MKKQPFLIVLQLLALVLLIQACGQDKKNVGDNTDSTNITEVSDTSQQNEAYVPPTPLEQKKWKLETMRFKDTQIKLLEGTESFVAFSNARISVTGACNHFMGSYKESGFDLTIEQMAGTKKACPETMAQDSKLIRSLEAAKQFEVSESGVHLVIKGTEGVLTFLAN
ncbi:MAG: hypothetical protein DHS20C18_19410 [Saprospiraceae bacterium]|nr:MAG: hypothetical protein DHS20C18_19410 [Saprospiraceae bacterium]